jgi:flavin-dependent dehydrogenase
MQVKIIGAGLAGCEAALWLADRGVQVELYEQKLQLALAKLEGRENADVLRAELTIRAAALREKLTSAEHDHLGTRRLLRAFPDMKSLNYADTLAATRAAMLRLRELAAAAKDAARETAANAKEKIKKA